MCQYAVTLLNGHYLCISMVLLTVGVCIQHTPSRLLRTRRHKERGRKGDLSVQLAFCSAGSNKNCLPGSPLRQGRLPRNPTGPPTIQTSDRGDCLQTLQRPYYTSQGQALQWPQDDNPSHTLFFIRGRFGHRKSPQVCGISHCSGEYTHPEWPEVAMLVWRLVY